MLLLNLRYVFCCYDGLPNVHVKVLGELERLGKCKTAVRPSSIRWSCFLFVVLFVTAVRNIEQWRWKYFYCPRRCPTTCTNKIGDEHGNYIQLCQKSNYGFSITINITSNTKLKWTSVVNEISSNRARNNLSMTIKSVLLLFRKSLPQMFASSPSHSTSYFTVFFVFNVTMCVIKDFMGKGKKTA